MQGEVQKINHRSICTIAEQQSFFVWIRFKSQNWQTRHTIFLYSLIYKFELKLMLFTWKKVRIFDSSCICPGLDTKVVDAKIINSVLGK